MRECDCLLVAIIAIFLILLVHSWPKASEKSRMTGGCHSCLVQPVNHLHELHLGGKSPLHPVSDPASGCVSTPSSSSCAGGTHSWQTAGATHLPPGCGATPRPDWTQVGRDCGAPPPPGL